MAVWIEVGPGFPGRELLEALAHQLDAAWTVYSDVRLPCAGGRSFRFDAVLAGPGGIHAMDFWMRPGRLEAGPWEWRTGDGGWVKSPALLLGTKVRALHRALRIQAGLAGPLEVGQILVVPEQGTEARNLGACIPHGSVVQGAARALARVRETGGRSPDADLLRRGMERLIAAAGIPPARPTRIGDWQVRGELEIEPHWRTFDAERAGDARHQLRVVPLRERGSDLETGLSREQANWQARLLEDLGRIPGFPAAGPPFEDELHGICQPFDTPGASVATWISRHPSASAAERLEAAAALARVVATLHREGLVHGAIGPWSLRLEDRPDARSACLDLLDLWRLVPPSCVDPQLWSRPQERFLAPELLLRWCRPTEASDQFGLGIALRHMLLGEPGGPWSLDLSAPGLKSPVSALLQRMTAHRPVDRFRGVEEAVQRLEGLGIDRSPAARPEGLAPGTRIDPEHEVIRHLHEGRRASVYELRHLESGSPRILKLAQRSHSAERALAHESELLQRLAHPRMQRSRGPGPRIAGRPSWIFDFLPGESLESLLRRGECLSEGAARRCANDLMDGLLYLHREGVTHGDLHPRHLIIGDGHLGIIDFSGQDARPGPRFRDPAQGSTVAAQDRYAAAHCLFELMTGRPAFVGGPPRSGVEPELEPEQFECADGGALAGVFRRALHPDPAERFSSAREMRAALVAAQRFAQRPWSVEAVEALRGLSTVKPSASIECLSLPAALRKALRRGGIRSVGELADLAPEALQRLPLAAWRVRTILLSIRERLHASGLGLALAGVAQVDLPLLPELGAHEGPMEILEYSPGLMERLGEAGLRSVGELALQGRLAIRQLPGIGPSGFGRVIRGLEVLRSRSRGELAGPATLEELWSALCGALEGRQREYLEARFGVHGTDPKSQRSLAKRFGGQAEPGAEARVLAALVPEVLAELLAVMESRFHAAPGWIELEALAQAVEARWPREAALDASGVARLACELLGWTIHEHRRLPRTYVSLRAEALDGLLDFATALDRIRKLGPRIWPEGAHAELARALRGLEHLALEPVIEIPGSRWLAEDCPDAGDGSWPISDPGELLARWLCRGGAALPEQVEVEELVGRFGAAGLLLGWVAEGGLPEELMEAGLLLSCGEPRPPSLVPRGLRKITALLDPPLESRELRQMAVELSKAGLSWLGAPLRREMQSRAARKVSRDGLDAGPSAILACGWQSRCAEIAMRLAAGGTVTASMFEGLEMHLCANENAEERDLLLELARLQRFLASSAPDAFQGTEKPSEGWPHCNEEDIRHGDLTVARIRRAMERTPCHRAFATQLLERFRRRREEWEASLQASPGGAECPVPESRPEPARHSPGRPLWWDASVSSAEAMAKDEPLAVNPRREARPTDPSGVPEGDSAHPETGAQLELELPVASAGDRLDLPGGLETEDAMALRTVATRKAVTERELVAALGWTPAEVVGSMARLRARLHSRGLTNLRIDVDATGATLYRFMEGGAAAPGAAAPTAHGIRLPDFDLERDLELAAAGASGWREVAAQGAVKLAEIGRSRDFGVSEISCKQPGSIGSPLDFYRSAVARLEIAGGGARELLQHWLVEVVQRGDRADPEVAVTAALAHLEAGPADLARALLSYRSFLDRGELQQALQVAEWLAGQGSQPTRGLRKSGLGRPLEVEDVPWLLRLHLSCMRQLGFAGWIVILREAEALLEPAGVELARSVAAWARWTSEGRMPGLELVLVACDRLEEAARRRLRELLEQEPPVAAEAVHVAPPRSRQKRGDLVELSLFPEEAP